MKVQCLCENKFEVAPITHIRLDDEPELIERIRGGKFNSFFCPKCNSAVKPQVVVHIEWKAKGVKIASIPEKERYRCLSFCKNKKKATKLGKEQPFNDDETLVIGVWELFDRINSLDAELETIPFEVLKFLVLDTAKIKKDNVELFLKGVENGNLILYVSGISKELGIISVPLSFYEDMLSDYKKGRQKQLFKAISVGNYISYKNILTD